MDSSDLIDDETTLIAEERLGKNMLPFPIPYRLLNLTSQDENKHTKKSLRNSQLNKIFQLNNFVLCI